MSAWSAIALPLALGRNRAAPRKIVFFDSHII
jgi:hypothetical protein